MPPIDDHGPYIILLRHAERLDRYMESNGEDWIHTASRPQDSPLSPLGEQQATATGKLFSKKYNVTKVLASPLIRTIQTAHLVCNEFESGPYSICVEQGLTEESKSLRGKTADQPRPNWNPLLFSAQELLEYSDRIDVSYESLVTVRHERDESVSNSVREVHDYLTDRDEITRDRCRRLVKILKAKSHQADHNCLLCVGHGATTGGFAAALQEGLPTERHIQGKRSVCSFAVFVPVDKDDLTGPWFAPSGKWEHIEEDVAGVENADDQANDI